MDRKDWVRQQIEKELDKRERDLFKAMKLEQRKDEFIFRMPIGVISFEGLWEKIVYIASTKNFIVKQAPVYATLDELDDVLGDITWLWDKWIPRGFITMLAGDPGIGKTGIAIDWVRIITSGECWPTSSQVARKGKAVWVDAEAGQQILRMRAKSLGVDRSKVFIPVIGGDILGNPDFATSQDRENIVNMVNGVKPDILVLDSLGGSNRRGENKVEEVRPLMEFLAGLARDKNIGLVLLHHLNKGYRDESTEVSLYRIRGSTVITAFCRSIIALEDGKDENEKKMRVIKSNLARISKNDTISIKAEMDSLEEIKKFIYSKYEPPTPKQTKKDQCAEWVLEMLSVGTKVALSDLKEFGMQLGFRTNMIYAAKESLGDRVTVSGTGNKAFWSLSSEDNDHESIEKITRNNGKH